MAGTISVGGLATGLDTNKIIDQLVALEHRPLDIVQGQHDDAVARQKALRTFGSKVFALLNAANDVRTSDSVIARKATSSDSSVVTATAGGGAVPGTTTVNVLALARGAIATSATGKTSTTATIASGAGSFVFKVGTGANQTVAIDATTTLQKLATDINALDAGVTASVVNAGTTAVPDYRLRLATRDTGTSHDLTIVTDNTTLGVAVTQGAQNASFTVTGFATPLSRERNTFDDVIPGVRLGLTALGGPVTVSVDTDVAGVTAKVQDFVTAFNDLVTFVNTESEVKQDTSSTDRSVTAGPLAFDSTVRTILSGIHGVLSDAIPALGGNITLLAQVGLTTERDGTLAFDTDKLATALTQDEQGVGALFGGNASSGGVADRLNTYLTALTRSGGLIDIRTDGVAKQITAFEDQLAAGQQHIDDFEQSLRTTFASLEVLVNSLQSQGAFLLSALGVGGNSK